MDNKYFCLPTRIITVSIANMLLSVNSIWEYVRSIEECNLSWKIGWNWIVPTSRFDLLPFWFIQYFQLLRLLDLIIYNKVKSYKVTTTIGRDEKPEKRCSLCLIASQNHLDIIQLQLLHLHFDFISKNRYMNCINYLNAIGFIINIYSF